MRVLFLLTILATSHLSSVEAFYLHPSSRPTTTTKRPSSSASLQIGNLFGGAFGGGSEKKNNGGGGGGTSTNTIIDMPGTAKPGALKFFMQIYLVGQQNVPTPNSWAINNNDENESIDIYYKDGTGMFSLGIKDTGIKIDRYGSRPSLEYMFQESVMLHGILDELTQVAEVEDIEPEKRLIIFQDSDAISKARENLPARKA